MYKILVIERDDLLLDLLEESLVLHGFDVITATTSQEAYKLTRLEQPDIILCCYLLADSNGLELLQIIRQDLKTQTIPFLLMTGSELENIPNWQVHLEYKDILLKPFTPKFLLKILASKLRSAQISNCQPSPLLVNP